MIDVVTERLQFSGRGRAKRVLVLQRPDGEPRGSVVVAHCFAASEARYTLTRLTRGLAEAGYAVLRWDFTGLGEGPPANDPVPTTANDLSRAAAMLSQRGYGGCSLVGHGVAGAATLVAASSVRGLASVVVIGAPAGHRSLRKLLSKSRSRSDDADLVVTGVGHHFPIDAELVDDIEHYEKERMIGELGKPLLVMHSLDDEVVPVEDGEKLFSAASQPKAFVPLLGADHLLTAPAAGEQVLKVVADWLHRTRPPARGR